MLCWGGIPPDSLGSSFDFLCLGLGWKQEQKSEELPVIGPYRPVAAEVVVRLLQLVAAAQGSESDCLGGLAVVRLHIKPLAGEEGPIAGHTL